jgi:hypothetical protein
MVFVIACTTLGLSLDTPSTVTDDVPKGYAFAGFELRYLLLLGVFYVDAGVTIVHRMIQGEKITSSHRKHLYQFLVNELNWPHLVVSSIYGVVQLGLSLLVVIYQPLNNGVVVIGGLLLALYVTLRKRVVQEIGRREVIRSVLEATDSEVNIQKAIVRKPEVALAGAAPLLPLDSVYNQQINDLRPLDSLPEESPDREPVEQASLRRKTLEKLRARTSLRSNRLPYRRGDSNA